jgi:hypothetical protein
MSGAGPQGRKNRLTGKISQHGRTNPQNPPFNKRNLPVCIRPALEPPGYSYKALRTDTHPETSRLQAGSYG